MNQIDIIPEEVQYYSKALLNEVKKMNEIYDNLKVSLTELDELWISHEKTAFLSVINKDLIKMENLLVSLNSFGLTSLSVANNRIERENNALKEAENIVK